MHQKKEIILVNLGSPDTPSTQDVRAYLKEFLSDDKVIDINPVGRWLLLNFFILPFRPKKTSEAYQKIWTEGGSPLVAYTKELAESVNKFTEPSTQVSYAMRYGKPAIHDVLDAAKARGVEHLIIAPLYPQYATSSTATTMTHVHRWIDSQWNVPSITWIPPFFDESHYLDAMTQSAKKIVQDFSPDYSLFSFHGLPERHMTKSYNSCLKSENCCDTFDSSNAFCYRAQCIFTGKKLASRLQIPSQQYQITFQSRLGRTPWIQPYTDVVLDELAQKGVKRLAVFCPSFVADCLETLEEIGIRAKEQFLKAGGEDLLMVPALNASDIWSQALARIICDQTDVALV